MCTFLTVCMGDNALLHAMSCDRFVLVAKVAVWARFKLPCMTPTQHRRTPQTLLPVCSQTRSAADTLHQLHMPQAKGISLLHVLVQLAPESSTATCTGDSILCYETAECSPCRPCSRQQLSVRQREVVDKQLSSAMLLFQPAYFVVHLA